MRQRVELCGVGPSKNRLRCSKLALVAIIVAAACSLAPGSASADGDPPANTTPPTVAGTIAVGDALTASEGTWTGDSPLSYTYQWEDCSSPAQTSCSNIDSATSDTYVLQSSDEGSWVAVTVTVTNDSGSTAATSAGALLADASTYPGEVLADGPDAFRQLDETSLSTAFDATGGGNNATYSSDVTSDMLNQPGVDGDGSLSLSGDPSAYVQIPGSLMADSGPFSVEVWFRTSGSGVILGRETTVGSFDFIFNPVLYVDSSGYLEGTIWWDGDEDNDGDPNTVMSLAPVNDGQWHEAVESVTSDGTETLTLDGTQQDSIALGSSVQTVPNATIGAGDAGYWSGNLSGWAGFDGQIADVALYDSVLTSAQIDAQSFAPQDDTAPAISGQAAQGQTLTASPGAWTGVPAPSYSYQWLSCNTLGTSCSPISGATDSTYTPVADDIGTTLEVTATASNTIGSASATSSPTTEVTPPLVPGCQGEQYSDCSSTLTTAGYTVAEEPVTDATCEASSSCYGSWDNDTGEDGPAGIVEGMSSTDDGTYTEAGTGEALATGSTVYVFVEGYDDPNYQGPVPACDSNYPEQYSDCSSALTAAGYTVVQEPVTDPTCESSGWGATGRGITEAATTRSEPLKVCRRLTTEPTPR